MSSRAYRHLFVLIGVVCVYALIRLIFLFRVRPVGSDILQGLLVGFGLAIVTARVVAMVRGTRVNGWTIMACLGLPSNGMVLRAAGTLTFPGPVNVPQEAMYSTTSVDGAGHPLSGAHTYTMHFPEGGLPPNQAFWSLTMGDGSTRFVPNPINR